MGLHVVDVTLLPGRLHGGLAGISFDIEEGALVVIGPPGSGQSELAAVLATVFSPGRGSIILNGLDVRRQKAEARRRIGYAPAGLRLFENLTVAEGLDHLALLSGISHGGQRQVRIDGVLRRLELLEARHTRIGRLSPATRQRTNIAQALLLNPSLVILDHPLADVPLDQRPELRALLSELLRDYLAVICTDDLADVEALADSVGVLQGGRARYFGPVEEFLGRLAGRVWEAECTAEQFRSLAVGTQITGWRRRRGGCQGRGIADARPLPNAVAATPSYSDAYLYALGGRT